MVPSLVYILFECFSCESGKVGAFVAGPWRIKYHYQEKKMAREVVGLQIMKATFYVTRGNNNDKLN